MMRGSRRLRHVRPPCEPNARPQPHDERQPHQTDAFFEDDHAPMRQPTRIKRCECLGRIVTVELRLRLESSDTSPPMRLKRSTSHLKRQWVRAPFRAVNGATRKDWFRVMLFNMMADLHQAYTP